MSINKIPIGTKYIVESYKHLSVGDIIRVWELVDCVNSAYRYKSLYANNTIFIYEILQSLDFICAAADDVQGFNTVKEALEYFMLRLL